MCVSTILLIKKDIHPHTQDIHKVMWASATIVTHPGLKTTCSLTHANKNTSLYIHTGLKTLASLDITACRVQASALSFNMTSFTPAVTCEEPDYWPTRQQEPSHSLPQVHKSVKRYKKWWIKTWFVIAPRWQVPQRAVFCGVFKNEAISKSEGSFSVIAGELSVVVTIAMLPLRTFSLPQVKDVELQITIFSFLYFYWLIARTLGKDWMKTNDNINWKGVAVVRKNSRRPMSKSITWPIRNNKLFSTSKVIDLWK